MRKKEERCFSFSAILFVVSFGTSVFAVSPSGGSLSIGSSGGSNLPSISGVFDAAGYSDGIYYGWSEVHPYSSHEVLSGEWGAAVCYDNIDTAIMDPNNPAGSRQAMWLTDYFKYPYWTTNSKFFIPDNQYPVAYDSSSNPITGCNDTGISYLSNGRLEVQIDYEIADLEQSSGLTKRSPMGFFTDPNNPQPMYVDSDRYVLLQTYTFHNADPNTPIENLAFYQFLHSHGANEYGPYVNSCYESIAMADALSDYTPINLVHCAPGQSTAGNFRYDITQWNTWPPYQTATHTDYVSFSSTRQPDWFDNDVYDGHSGRPSTGTHIHIENRQLNDIPAIYNAEVGGAMGWDLGTLNPGASKSITIAFMCGHGEPEEIDIDLTKTTDVPQGQKVWPGDEFVYTIRWENYGDETAENVLLKDYLPKGVTVVKESLTAPSSPIPANPNVIYGITDANNLTDIILPVGQSVRLYLTKETFEEDVLSFYLEANISDPNLGWIDNTEYDPNNPGTAEILASPRASFFDYYGPGYTQPEGIQFFAASFAGPMEDGNLASFVYTATQPGYVVLTLVDYNAIPATLEEIVIRQVDPNDPNNVPGEPNEAEEPPAYSASPVSGVYDEQTRTITWQLDDIAPGASGSVSFKVVVNEAAEPGMFLHNDAVLTSSVGTATASEDTPVACWDNDDGIIYVDFRANGANIGTSWTDAYTELQPALTRMRAGCEDINTIYIAAGTYSPGREAESSFEIPDGVSVYGGFPTGGCDFGLRNPKQYETILTGIGGVQRNETVVKMGNNSLLDGVIVRDAAFLGQGILCEDVDSTIANCTVKDNLSYGIYADNSAVELRWCRLENNGYDGLRHIGNGKSILVENCQINDNSRYGLYLEDSASVVKNTVICRNGVSDSTFYGIRIRNPVATPNLFNNTIAYNYNEAIAYITDNDPNHVNIPNIQNCIIWYNNRDGSTEQFAGWKVPTQYSCVYDPNDADGVSETIDGNHNFSHKPDFAYPYSDDPNVPVNVHLQYNSFCKERGNPGLPYEGQKDMDNEERVADSVVDVGADEIHCDQISNALDWDADGIVNLNEFRKFSDVWLSHDPNDPAVLDPNNPVNDPNSPSYIDPNSFIGWDDKCNLFSTGTSQYTIDVADLLVFLEDAPWLWVACWRMDILEMQQMSMLALSESEGMMASVLPETSQSVEAAPVMPVIAPAASVVQPVEIVVTESIEPEEKSIEEQIADLQEAIQLLESIGNDPNTQLEIQASDWQEFMNEVRNSLTELQEKDIITQDKVED